MMNPSTLALTGVAVVMAAVGQVVLKAAVRHIDLAGALAEGLFRGLITAITAPVLWGAMLIYVVAVALWLMVLTRVDVSVAYPLVSLGFVLTLILAAVLLGEPVGVMRTLGVVLIVAGCFLVGRSAA